MQRRKFITGLGALATGAAAAVGTGAVTSTRLQREFSASVAGGASANLGISPNSSSDFVTNTSPVAVDFSGDQNSQGGLNQNAVTEVRPAFTLQNNFSNDLYVEINNPLKNGDISDSQTNNLSASTNGSNSVTVPAGLDVQFIATTSAVTNGNGSNSSQVDLIDRSAAPASSSGPDGGNDFQEQVSPGSIKTDLDQFGGGGNRVPFGNGDAGYIKLRPGNQVDVIARALVNGYTGGLGSDLTSAPFIIRGFTDDSNMVLDEEAAVY